MPTENKPGKNGEGDEDRQVGRISVPQRLVWRDIIDEQRVGVGGRCHNGNSSFKGPGAGISLACSRD